MSDDLLARVRAVATQLPEAAEQTGDGATAFVVADRPFAEVRDGGAALAVRTGDGWEVLDLGDAPDWQLMEDRVALAWELTAPDRLLEAGGR